MNADVEGSDLFPMPLSSMEQFHWFDTSPQFPNQIYGRLRFDGQIQRTLAEQAVQIVMDRQPMLGVVISQKNGQLTWHQPESLSPPIRWHSDDQDVRLEPIDFEKEFPWRVNFQNTTAKGAGTNQSEIWFQASHAVFDGLGATQLISDWLKTYHQLSNPKATIRSHRLCPNDLKNRNRLGLLQRSYLKNLWKQPLGLFGAAKFICRKPAELYSDVTDAAWDFRTQPCAIGTWLDEAGSEKLKQRAAELNVNTNTLLVGELMRLLQEACCRNQDNGLPWIRIILPISIRSYADRRMPAANRATVVQVDRRAADFRHEGFYQSLNREIGIIREWELGKLFLIAVRGMSTIPGMLKRAAANQKCRGTAIFANLGEPFGRLGLPVVDNKIHVGDLQLNDFDFVGPIRSRTPINFSVQKHLDRHRISLHFDPRFIAQDQAAQLLNQYVSAIGG